MADVLALGEPQRRVVSWMLRQGEVTLADIAAFVGVDHAAARTLLAPLIERGVVREVDCGAEIRYRVRLAYRPRRVPPDIWQAMNEKGKEGED